MPTVSKPTTHPGVLLKDEIECRKLSKSETAKKLGLKPGHLSEIFSAKRKVSVHLAIKLEQVLEIPAENWLLLQIRYDIELHKKNNKKP